MDCTKPLTRPDISRTVTASFTAWIIVKGSYHRVALTCRAVQNSLYIFCRRVLQWENSTLCVAQINPLHSVPCKSFHSSSFSVVSIGKLLRALRWRSFSFGIDSRCLRAWCQISFVICRFIVVGCDASRDCVQSKNTKRRHVHAPTRWTGQPNRSRATQRDPNVGRSGSAAPWRRPLFPKRKRRR